jgi:hypothetical protein
MTSNRLPVLAAEINEAHALALKHADSAVEQAMRCGNLLMEAKAKAPHGHWLPWLRQNVEFSERTAQAYMRIAQRFNRNPQRATDLSARRCGKSSHRDETGSESARQSSPP